MRGLAAMEPGRGGWDDLMEVLAECRRILAAMEPGRGDRADAYDEDDWEDSEVPQWSPVVETGMTRRPCGR